MAGRRQLDLARHSFLRSADPRTKLVLALCASAGVMLSLRPLALFCACYFGLILAARLARHAAANLARVAPLVVVLFAVDSLFIGFEFALLITLRVVLLVTAFTVVFATTTPDELRVALERWHVPQRFALAFATAYCSLGLLQSEWRAILEAQQARGIFVSAASPGWRGLRARLASAVSLIVPAVVLVAQRAWSINEAAAVRGFESPARHPYRARCLGAPDYLLLSVAGVLLLCLFTTT
jgi:energy-coupling factor transport system permease protein